MKINWKFLLGLAALAIVLYWIVGNPAGSADGLHSGLGHLKKAADQITLFLSMVFA